MACARGGTEALHAALADVGRLRRDRRARENHGVTVFEALRRACLDAVRSDSLQSMSCSDAKIEDAWLFLIEARQLYPSRRRRVDECARACAVIGPEGVDASGGVARGGKDVSHSRWARIFQDSASVREALDELAWDARMELAVAVLGRINAWQLFGVTAARRQIAEKAQVAPEEEGNHEAQFALQEDEANSMDTPSLAVESEADTEEPLLDCVHPTDDGSNAVNRLPLAEVGGKAPQLAFQESESSVAQLLPPSQVVGGKQPMKRRGRPSRVLRAALAAVVVFHHLAIPARVPRFSGTPGVGMTSLLSSPRRM